jgi:hypothetical protein
MADTEVENILREIRERVYAEQEAPIPARLNGANGGDNSPENGQMKSGDLARLESYLTTTARAWDRLPPLVSNRSGAPARLELWFKRHLKRATRWYAWEQVNFNAAVHHALGDMVHLFSAYEKNLADQRQQLLAESEALRAESDARRAEAQRHQSEIQALRSELNTQRATIDAQQKLIADQRAATDAQSAAISAAVESRAGEVDGTLAAIVSELREATARLQEEQRVTYKQLALETGEAAVLGDRARRKTEALLEQLQRRMDEIEKK